MSKTNLVISALIAFGVIVIIVGNVLATPNIIRREGTILPIRPEFYGIGTSSASFLQAFINYGSSTAWSAYDGIEIGNTSTTTIRGDNATSTFVGSITSEGITLNQAAISNATLLSDNDINWGDANYYELALSADTVISFSNVSAGQIINLGLFLTGNAEPSWASSTNIYWFASTNTPPILSEGVHLCTFRASTSTNFVYGACNIGFEPFSS